MASVLVLTWSVVHNYTSVRIKQAPTHTFSQKQICSSVSIYMSKVNNFINTSRVERGKKSRKNKNKIKLLFYKFVQDKISFQNKSYQIRVKKLYS